MKKLIIPGIAIIAFAFSMAEGFLQTLKITKEVAENGIWYSFSTGSYNGPASQTYHTFSVPVRVAMVKEVGAFAKAYTRTDDFKNKYSAHRESLKPTPPEALVSMADQKKLQRETIQKSINETEANMKNYTGDMKKTFDEVLTMMKAQLKQIDDPNNPIYNPAMEDMQRQSHAAEMQEYQIKLRTWDQEYPILPTAMIKQQLSYFLQVSSTVDFTAKLGKGPEGKMIFTDKEYENKTSDWKFIYRSGKESTDAARAIATQWLGELK